MEYIKDNGLVFGLLVHKDDFPNGLKFYGNDMLPLQFGSCVYESGVELRPHYHKVRDRMRAHKTLEFLYIIRGKVEANFYRPNRQLVRTVILQEGDCIMLYDGGHGFKVLENNTVFIEVKNGPFTSVFADKEKF